MVKERQTKSQKCVMSVYSDAISHQITVKVYYIFINTFGLGSCTGVDHCGKTCQAESDNQWLGVSLSRRPSNGDVLVRLLVFCGYLKDLIKQV